MRVLFICPDWAGLATPIVNEMRKQGHSVTLLDHSDFSSFSYFNKTHRALSKCYQVFTGENYKHRQTYLEISRTINSFCIDREKFDAIIMTEPSLFEREHLQLLKQHCDRLVATLWDSLTKSPKNKQNLDLFDTVFSYDEEDCSQYNLIKINNYIDSSWFTEVPIQNAKFDVFSVMSFTKDRYQELVKFLDRNPHISPNIYLYIDNERKRKYIKDSRINIINKIMLGDELKSKIESSKAILDLLQGHQAGLSFRVYEAIAYKRKIITTNSNVSNYDFYNSNNVFILNSKSIPREFFDSQYSDLADSIIDNYRLSTWVKKVFSSL